MMPNRQRVSSVYYELRPIMTVKRSKDYGGNQIFIMYCIKLVIPTSHLKLPKISSPIASKVDLKLYKGQVFVHLRMGTGT